jgi:hypothetical protein
MYLPGSGDVDHAFNLGQVLKGKVLRQYEGGRYLVNFDGRERIVDSAIPFRTGEILHGRVVAFGERVEMQRVYPEAVASQPANTDVADGGVRLPGSRQQEILDSLMSQYQVRMPEADQAVLLRAMHSAADPQSMAQAGIHLNRLGLGQAPVLLDALYSRLLASGGLFPERASQWVTPPQLETSLGAAGSATTVRQLGEVLQTALEASEADHDDTGASGLSGSDMTDDTAGAKESSVHAVAWQSGEGGGKDDFRRRLAHWLLNAQSDGSVAHRIGSLPLLLGGQLIEVDVAMFEQRRDALKPEGTQHRQIVFSLNTEQLGKVEVVIRVTGEHVRVRFATDDADKTGMAAGHMDALTRDLAAAGWKVDEVSYETLVPDVTRGTVRSVVEHVITQHSLNRLI